MVVHKEYFTVLHDNYLIMMHEKYSIMMHEKCSIIIKYGAQEIIHSHTTALFYVSLNDGLIKEKSQDPRKAY